MISDAPHDQRPSLPSQSEEEITRTPAREQEAGTTFPAPKPLPVPPRPQRTFSMSNLAMILAVWIMGALLSFGVGVTMMASKAGSGTTSTSQSSSSMSSSMNSSSSSNAPNATEEYGNQLAHYTIDPDGAKHFTLTASQVMWDVVGGHRELAWAINGTVPGPMLRVTAGDHVRITFINKFPDATAVHWHGLEVSTKEDGVPGVGQDPIKPGQTHVYDFTLHDQDVGTHWYHSHLNDVEQESNGFYGAFIVDPRPGTPQAKQAIKADVEFTAFLGQMNGYYLISGKSFPDTQTIQVKHGQTVHVRLIGADSTMMHPIHIHGHTFNVVAEDGHLLPQPIQKDTLQVAPGETYDITFTAWATAGSVYPIHCHILSHVMNPGQKMDEMGGMIVLIKYVK